MLRHHGSEQVVLITGGTSGIGLSLAEAFLAQGDEVAVLRIAPKTMQRSVARM